MESAAANSSQEFIALDWTTGNSDRTGLWKLLFSQALKFSSYELMTVNIAIKSARNFRIISDYEDNKNQSLIKNNKCQSRRKKFE